MSKMTCQFPIGHHNFLSTIAYNKRPCDRTYLNTVKSHQHGKTHESPLWKKVRPAHFSDPHRKGGLAGRGEAIRTITITEDTPQAK